MTTEDSAKAQEQNTNEEAKAIEQVSDDVKNAVEEAVNSPETEEAPLTRADLDAWAAERKAVFDQAQGRAQNITQEKIKEVQDAARQEINSAVQDLEDMLDDDAKEMFRQKRAQREAQEQQAEMQEAIKFYKEAKNNANNISQTTLSKEELGSLEDGINAVAKNLGVSITARDNSVWNGWTTDMNYNDSLALATKNISAMAKSGSTTQTPKPKGNVPPSTQGAPTTAKKLYNNQAELARAFSSGEIDLQQFKELKNKL
tara:strand:+ start:357 stop:1130 length:774 start_codon:yes stop_codon:yes gene_type:complete